MEIKEYYNIEGVESILIIDKKGRILNSSYFEHTHKENIALMTQNLYEKSKGFISDFITKDVQQILFRFEGGFLLLSKFDNEKIILIYSIQESNLGILLSSLKKVN